MIETKLVRIEKIRDEDKESFKRHSNYEKYIADLQCFGWEKKEEITKRSGRIHVNYQVMIRDTDMPNYKEYKKCELEYENAKNQLKTYKKIEVSTALVLLLLFIIPGVIYIYIKSKQKENIEKTNIECQTKMNNSLDLAKKINQN